MKRWFRSDLEPLYKEAVDQVADFVGADHEDLVRFQSIIMIFEVADFVGADHEDLVRFQPIMMIFEVLTNHNYLVTLKSLTCVAHSQLSQQKCRNRNAFFEVVSLRSLSPSGFCHKCNERSERSSKGAYFSLLMSYKYPSTYLNQSTDRSVLPRFRYHIPNIGVFGQR